MANFCPIKHYYKNLIRSNIMGNELLVYKSILLENVICPGWIIFYVFSWTLLLDLKRSIPLYNYFEMILLSIEYMYRMEISYKVENFQETNKHTGCHKCTGWWTAKSSLLILWIFISYLSKIIAFWLFCYRCSKN